MPVIGEHINQLDVALILVGKPNSDYRAAAAAPSMSELNLAVAELDCWPNTPVEGEHGAMSCS
jgi:hypothetical protein